MITASHNPREDNGYKLYTDDGAQIIPPADTDIEAAIDEVGPLADVPLAPADSELISRAGEEMVQSYLDAICAITPAPPSAAWLRFVYTPLHGVAGRLALRAFAQAGFSEPDVVEAQFEPDPEFPTVNYPNPEEPGTLDLALAQARRSAADLVIANDPDGDRLAVAVPDPDAAGGWRVLTGDQVGALLGAFLLGRLGADPDVPMSEQLVVSTIVSGTLLAKIAAAAGAQHAQTLTGFKWISRAGDLRAGTHFVFGYEEALGYEVTQTVRDKDGMSAALAILCLAAVARSTGESLLDAYNGLEVTHGVHLTAQLTMQSTTTTEVMARLRAAAPAELGGLPVVSVTDYTGGSWLRKVIAFIPNQLLFYLPMQALAKKGTNGEMRYLIEDKQIVYLTAADVMNVVQRPDEEKSHQGMVAFGNPTGAELPSAELEVKTIAQFFPETEVLLGGQATKAAVNSEQRLDKRVVHFATHGFLNATTPAQSYIQLASGETPGQERLTVGEVWDLPFKKVDLVTLSACETALGDRDPDGGEITTLAEAFSSAGATAVLASLWSVGDQSTKEFMIQFYQQLAAGQSKAASLQSAQISLMTPSVRAPKRLSLLFGRWPTKAPDFLCSSSTACMRPNTVFRRQRLYNAHS